MISNTIPWYNLWYNELILFRRNGLKTAVGGRDEKSLGLLLQYLAKYINDPRFSQLLMEVVDVVLGIDYQRFAVVKADYNALSNSLQRFNFNGTLGPEGMLAPNWLLSCVKFCAKPPSVSKRWVCHFFSL